MKFRRKRGKGKRRRVRYVAVLPTLITLGNAVCGLLAIFQLFKTPPDYLAAAWLILGALVFDGLDGVVARATRSTSPFGAQLDSLCDALSFGVAPAILVVHMVTGIVKLPAFTNQILVAVAVLYACCVLIRLARYNVEAASDKPLGIFAGLPSPGAGGLLASAIVTYYFWVDEPGWSEVGNGMLVYGLPCATFVLGLLMVSRMPYPHILNRLLQGRRPFTKLIEVVIAILLIVVLHQVAIFVGFLVFVGSGPVVSIKRLVWRKPAVQPKDESVH